MDKEITTELKSLGPMPGSSVMEKEVVKDMYVVFLCFLSLRTVDNLFCASDIVRKYTVSAIVVSANASQPLKRVVPGMKFDNREGLDYALALLAIQKGLYLGVSSDRLLDKALANGFFQMALVLGEIVVEGQSGSVTIVAAIAAIQRDYRRGVKAFLNDKRRTKGEISEVACQALRKGNVRAAQLLIDDERFDPGYLYDGAIVEACKGGYYGIVQLLLRHRRFDPRAVIRHDLIRRANSYGHPEVAKLLEADPRVRQCIWNNRCDRVQKVIEFPFRWLYNSVYRKYLLDNDD